LLPSIRRYRESITAKWDDPAVAWLAKKLEEDPERPTLLLMHHHPFPCGIPYLDI